MTDPGSPTEFPKLVGDTYARWTLDCLVEIGYAVSIDFVSRPYLYKGDIPDAIVNLRMSYGSDPDFPNAAQRQAMMLPIFGRSDGMKPDATSTTPVWPFQIARRNLIDACTAFSERAVDTGVPMLEQNVRSALTPLKNHLLSINGKSFHESGDEIQDESDTVYQILSAPGVDAVFSISTPIAQGWPLSTIDPNGSLLVQNSGSVLPVPADCKLKNVTFERLQEAAQQGSAALSLVLTIDPNNEQQLLTLISQCYTWGKSLYDYQKAAA